jgi:hemolysin III
MQQASNERMAREEFANALTHGAGAVLSAAGGAVLIVLAALRGDAWLVVGSAIFAAALLLLYTSSTLYHAARTTVLRRRFKVLDHCAIYVLIAGTYTPFMLGTRGGWGWSLFGVVWGLAAAGVVFKLFFTGRFRLLSTVIYVAMGWLVLVGIAPLTRAAARHHPDLAAGRRHRLHGRHPVLPPERGSASATRSGTASSWAAAYATASPLPRW